MALKLPNIIGMGHGGALVQEGDQRQIFGEHNANQDPLHHNCLHQQLQALSSQAALHLQTGRGHARLRHGPADDGRLCQKHGALQQSAGQSAYSTMSQ